MEPMVEEAIVKASGSIGTILVNATLAAYILAALAYLLYAVTSKKVAHIIGFAIVVLGTALNTALIVQRWVEGGYPPFTNMYESMVFFGWAIGAAFLVSEKIIKIGKAGWLVMIIAALTIAFASFYTDAEMKPLIPALQSNWLTVHVIAYFCAYAVLTLSFVTSIIYFFKHGKSAPEGGQAPGRKVLLITRKSIQFAFPLLTVGLITGAVWANQAWGSYWSWDPKETWSLITWLIYLNFLHLHYTLPGVVKSLGWKPKSAALVENIFAFAGFLLNGFTYLGVNYLLAGLHAYA